MFYSLKEKMKTLRLRAAKLAQGNIILKHIPVSGCWYRARLHYHTEPKGGQFLDTPEMHG